MIYRNSYRPYMVCTACLQRILTNNLSWISEFTDNIKNKKRRINNPQTCSRHVSTELLHIHAVVVCIYVNHLSRFNYTKLETANIKVHFYTAITQTSINTLRVTDVLYYRPFQTYPYEQGLNVHTNVKSIRRAVNNNTVLF